MRAAWYERGGPAAEVLTDGECQGLPNTRTALGAQLRSLVAIFRRSGAR